MKTVTKTKWEYRKDQDGNCHMIEIPYEKYIFDDDDKMRIVPEYFVATAVRMVTAIVRLLCGIEQIASRFRRIRNFIVRIWG